MEVPDSAFLNREISWLEFNRRVLYQALDERNPLLERVRFHSIFTSNLDEFYMKRVGGLQRQVLAQVPSSGLKKISPRDQLMDIRKTVVPMIHQQAEAITGQILPLLAKEGIHLLTWEELSPSEQIIANDFFEKRVFPVLTPLAVDPGHPFPFISNLSVSFGVLMRNPERDEELFARIKVPSVFPSWVRVNAESETEVRLVSLPDLIAKKLGSLFPGMELQGVMAFRVTRNADVDRDEEDAEDLLEMVAEELRERRFARPVRLEHGPNPNPKLLSILKEELEIADDDIYELPLWLEYFSLGSIVGLDRPKLKFSPFVPATPPALVDQEANIFDIIRAGDILVHHPYETFTGSVERFIRTAASDPKVIAIKMTLYRTGEDSPFIPLLIRAAESGKQVACLVELQARFDEERNIFVAQALEKAGVHVVYGIIGLKTHCKVALVVRQETDGVRCYAHLGTGNYHAQTARLYTDLGLFTAKTDYTEDIVHLFHYLTGRSLRWWFKKLLVAPIDMKESFLRMIHREVEWQKQSGKGHIIAKMNSLEDREIIEALYQASDAGVKIELIVRGFCCLRPKVAGLSENIRVISIVGRFLEHSRLFYFRNGADIPQNGQFFMGSADWMYRNLNTRVEAVGPVEEAGLRHKCWDILQTVLNDDRLAWDMQSDGTYIPRGDGKTDAEQGSQSVFLRMSRPTTGAA